MRKLLLLAVLAAGCGRPADPPPAPAPAAPAPPPASPDQKLDAIRAALRSGGVVSVVGYLQDESAEVRRAAVLAVGPVPDGQAPAVPDDDLFPRLHDPDPEVRQLAAAALRGRGLTDERVQLARQLVSPVATDRLSLLLDLTDSGAVTDPGPWLERLSRDPEPAVRLGAARLAFECKVVYAGWLDRLAEADPNPLVRRWAGYWRQKVKARN